MKDISNIMLERRGLIRVFNKFKDYRIIAICAPAGYGKSVAVTQWLDKDTRAKAIFSMDEFDNNLAGFCERFCAALQLCQPQNQTLANIITHAFFQDTPSEFALRAVSALSKRKQAVLAIDNLHSICSSEIMRLLLVLIKRLPSNFKLVLISRSDLPLELSDLVVKGQIAYVNTEHFLFTDKDIMALYKKRGTPITQEHALHISQQTQGWAIGINAFLLSDEEPSGKVYDYLDNFTQLNIWEKYDETIRDFMLRTAALRELTPPLCNVIAEVDSSDCILKRLTQTGAFIVTQPTGTYQYHKLFQQFLLRKARKRGEMFMQALLKTEGYWHLSNSDFYNAIDCFIRCKYHLGIAKCFDLLETVGHKDFVVERLLPILKHEVVLDTAKKHPHLLRLTSFCALVEGRIDDMASIMDEYYDKHPQIIFHNPAHDIHYVRMMDFRIPLSKIINEMEVPDNPSNYAIAKRDMSMHMPFMHRGIRDYSEMAAGDIVENVIAQKSAKLGWLYGERRLLLNEIIIAELLYEQGDLEKAHEYAIRANAMIKSHTISDTKLCAMLALVRVLDALDEFGEADAILKSTSQMIAEDRAPHLYYNFNACILRRQINAGNIKAAEGWIEAKTFGDLSLREMYIALTTCRALIAAKKYAAALILLNKALAIAISHNRPLDIIEARILLAIACWEKKKGFQTEAIEHLEEACLTAYPYNYVQMFICEGAKLSGMLLRLQNRVAQRNTEAKEHLGFIKILYLKTSKSNNVRPQNEPFKELLKFTDKQKVIMNLLCKGKTYNEISKTVGIKQSSLRNHITLIYKKLGVTNIADAIAKIDAIKPLE